MLQKNLRVEKLGLYVLIGWIFGGIGCALVFLWVQARKAEDELAHAVKRFPSRPWMWKKEWADGCIASSEKQQMWVACGLAFIWNAVSLPMCLMLPWGLFDKESVVMLIGITFPMVGAGLLVWAGCYVARWKRFGTSYLEMASVPGVVGGALAGRVRVRHDFPPERGFKLTLQCIKRMVSGPRRHRRATEHVLWQEQTVMTRDVSEEDAGPLAVPVLFRIPFEQPETLLDDPDCEILWRLEVAADAEGMDYTARFEVPVFKTDETDLRFTLDKTLVAGYQASSCTDDVQTPSGFELKKEASGGLSVCFPRARHKDVAVACSCLFLIWTSMVVCMLYGHVPFIFPAVVGLFDVLFLYLLLEFWFEVIRIEVSAQGVSVLRKLFGRGSSRYYARDKIKTFRAVRGMRCGRKLFYTIQLITKDDEAWVIGKTTFYTA